MSEESYMGDHDHGAHRDGPCPGCERERREISSTPLARASRVAATLENYRYAYGNEDELQLHLANVLDGGWTTIREYPLGTGRIDIYVPELRVGVEVKVAGKAPEVLRQLARYANHPDIDALVLVTNRLRHRFAADVAGVPLVTVTLLGL